MSRSPLTILVPESHSIAAIACIRSLGRAGHRVIAYAQNASALGLASRYATIALIAPRYEETERFRSWLLDTVSRNRVDLIFPSEGLLLAIRRYFPDFAGKLPVGGSETEILGSLSKFTLFSRFARSADPRLREHLPRYSLMGPHQGTITGYALEDLRAPLYLKLDALHGSGGPSQVRRFDDLESLRLEIPAIERQYDRYLVQEHAEGIGVGAFFLRWNGAILATLMHRRLHEVPYTGGQSSLRETWWHERIHADAENRLNALDWQGVGMFEYRWDPASDEFRLMEFNARFWGSLHLALFAGVDFPALLVTAWRGQPQKAPRPVSGLKCRLTFPNEIEHVASRLKARELSGVEKLRSVVEFFALSLDPRVRSDLWFPGDTGLYWRAIAQSFRKFFS